MEDNLCRVRIGSEREDSVESGSERFYDSQSAPVHALEIGYPGEEVDNAVRMDTRRYFGEILICNNQDQGPIDDISCMRMYGVKKGW